ncbi:ATP-binding protein [Pseudenhygromyxa sp. WMMC2535]|uniref:ATP-binding protein n=1 Tax=Pseudenhygromyxa sp. WMMC2535 TaxID=2712867 RepID=UPI00155586D6|nr:ATP-binding protein [Pseudenhygromyxa sp. WMMC2535]NVB42497.1 ATP-binding protein [Pseudenhygromyxa sp. WMMC2535]
MASPAALDVGDALDELVNQFADPMSFFRELIQNALDAGSAEVEVSFEFEANADNPDQGAMVVSIVDAGEGMDREIIDSRLTRLFSSAKDGDMTKIGKFGIGFVSVFAIEPDAVCVDTARAGEAWRVLFDKQRNFKRLRLDQALEGTSIRIIKSSKREDYERFVARASEVIRYWCRHANGEVWVDGALISEPFGLDAPLCHEYRDEFSHIFLGHEPGSPTRHAYFNGGLTLVEAEGSHNSVMTQLRGLVFKVSSRYLEHTLTRDDVIKDAHHAKVAARLVELAHGPLRELVFAELDACVRAQWPREPGAAAERLHLLYEAAHWHLCASGLSRITAKLACARSPSGRVYTWNELRGAVRDGDDLLLCAEPSPLSDAAEAQDLVVVATYAGVTPSSHAELARAPDLAPMLAAFDALREDAGASRWLEERFFIPTDPPLAERRGWQPLATAVAEILDDTGHKIGGCRFGCFERSGSALAGRVAISQREYGELTPVDEAGEITKGLFSRRRVLVVDADNPAVRTLLGLAKREVELAAYQLIKLFFVHGGAISPAQDSALASAAMSKREARCPRPQS